MHLLNIIQKCGRSPVLFCLFPTADPNLCVGHGCPQRCVQPRWPAACDRNGQRWHQGAGVLSGGPTGKFYVSVFNSRSNCECVTGNIRVTSVRLERRWSSVHKSDRCVQPRSPPCCAKYRQKISFRTRWGFKPRRCLNQNHSRVAVCDVCIPRDATWSAGSRLHFV